jgi:tetratricopeptide (TPR) repeat protein
MFQAGMADLGAAEVEWHYLRAFRLAHDQPAMQKHLEKLLTMDQDQQVLQKDPGMAADIVPALQDLGRGEQADRIFDAAYQALLDKVTAAPADPMPKNNLAWLCACSGKKLDEAVKYADQAVALDPEDAACLDTQAEAYFRTGRAREALEIETRALEFKPDDLYMARQVERFRAAAARK